MIYPDFAARDLPVIKCVSGSCDDENGLAIVSSPNGLHMLHGLHGLHGSSGSHLAILTEIVDRIISRGNLNVTPSTCGLRGFTGYDTR